MTVDGGASLGPPSEAPSTVYRHPSSALHRLHQLTPRAVERAEAALDVALAATRNSCWPEIAWRASRLTNTGCPVELSWSSRDAAVRWSSEACGPETPESLRLRAALDVLHDLGANIVLPDWIEPRSERFGAWIGGRHDGIRDRYKLYVEIESMPFSIDAIPERLTWRMAGVENDSLELYGRLSRPAIFEVQRLFAAHGLDASAVVAMARHLFVDDLFLLPGTAGLSLVFRDARIAAIAVLVHAGPLIGNDERVAAKLRAIAAGYSFDTTHYEALLGNPPSETPGRHGILAFGVALDGKPWLQTGLRP